MLGDVKDLPKLGVTILENSQKILKDQRRAKRVFTMGEKEGSEGYSQPNCRDQYVVRKV